MGRQNRRQADRDGRQGWQRDKIQGLTEDRGKHLGNHSGTDRVDSRGGWVPF
ncbi:MAG: hypothetical protein ABIK43_04285 [candidate division WOR-3 bacterium]